MIIQARIRENLKDTEGLDWISPLRAPQIKKLVEQSAIQLSLFDERNLASIKSEDYPGERLIACLKPLLAAERKKNRE